MCGGRRGGHGSEPCLPPRKGRLLCCESPGPGDRSRVKECHRRRACSSPLMVRVSAGGGGV